MNNSIFKLITLCVAFSFFLSSCYKEKKITIYDALLPDSPVNLGDINSEFDDYNSAAPIGDIFPLCFSSNRNSNGANFSIVFNLVGLFFDEYKGKSNIGLAEGVNSIYYCKYSSLNSALNKINTGYDEFGPYLLPKGSKHTESNIYNEYESYIFLYSNNNSGNQDIKFTQNILNESYEKPLNVNFLNSDYDDAYPSFNNDLSKIYFTSNREKNFDIYIANIDNKIDLIEYLTTTNQTEIQKDTILSSKLDDKCPYISGNTLVFTSNRAGGFGGYDLYYSKWENCKWSAPKNFGEKINTAFDEYRPIVIPEKQFKNDLMIFSSNRPGGKGGFDLYYVGIDKIEVK